VNVVVQRGVNDGEVAALAALTLERDWSVRFIEWMPFGVSGEDAAGAGADPVPSDEVRARIASALGPLSEVPDGGAPRGAGPAVLYRAPGARGTIGFISPLSQHFCPSCNRLRLTADGRLRPCLLADEEVDVRGPLRAGADKAALQELIREAVRRKPARHHLAGEWRPQGRLMSQIGG